MIDLELLRYLRRDAIIVNFDFARFMADSNRIEGEDGLNPKDLTAARAFIDGPLSERTLLACHGQLAEHLGVDWGGRYRDCDVRVGDYLAPPFDAVRALMAKFWRAVPKLDSWEAHNRFHKIHPFRDLNGRTGRLLWLHKAIDEGYTGRIDFLHCYYYQTLARERPPSGDTGGRATPAKHGVGHPREIGIGDRPNRPTSSRRTPPPPSSR